VNQETPLATALGSASGYPHFNTPTEMGDALIDAGFDVANMGNNHMFDMGVDGAYVTREYWDEKNIPCTGFYYGYDDLFDFRIIEKNGIKVAFLSFVEMTNDELPSDYSAIVVYMNDPDLVRSMIEEAREKADVVVVHAHWGDENTDETNDYVYNEAQKLVDWGADIVFGNHSHVLQDLVTLTRESDGQKCPVIYSLGNFFSAQKVRDQLVSGMLNVQVTKDASGKVKPTAMGFLPIVTHYTGDRENLALYPLNMYSDELALMHGTATVSTDGLPMSMDYIESLLEKHIPAQYLGKMGPIE
jgi:poly-gamma-glutamate synthesis protein (capsule biosynthesis protein)